MALGARRTKKPRQGVLNKPVWLFGLIVLSIGLLVFGRTEIALVQAARDATASATAPIFDTLSGPVGRIRSFASRIGSYTYLSDEVGRLRSENDELKIWRARAQEMRSRLIRYEELLNVRPEPELSFVTARVIADTRGPFVHTVIVNAGTAQGVREHRAVMDGRGLVGRTISTGAEASRVLLLTDLNSRIPVRVEPHGVRAILTGTNTDTPRLDFLPNRVVLQDGDLVFTSGDGGQLPPGLAVGEVRIDGAGAARVTPYADPARLRFVRIFEYQPTLSSDAQAELNDAAAEGGAAASVAIDAEAGHGGDASRAEQ